LGEKKWGSCTLTLIYSVGNFELSAVQALTVLIRINGTKLRGRDINGSSESDAISAKLTGVCGAAMVNGRLPWGAGRGNRVRGKG